MGISKPYHRNYRAFVQSSSNWEYSQWAYIVDHEYATAPMHYTRAFLLLQKDIQQLFEFIEPADVNLKTYSYRIHQLFMRICVEIEANFKAILKDNIYSKNEKNWNIQDYKKINKTHHLDAYLATYPIWDGDGKSFTPFRMWASNDYKLQWWTDYNLTKHNRQEKRNLANMDNLLNAFSALFILLSSQFNGQTFAPGNCLLSFGTNNTYYGDGEFGIGEYLLIKYPNNWGEDEKYDFNWDSLKNESDRFQKFNYDTIK